MDRSALFLFLWRQARTFLFRVTWLPTLPATMAAAETQTAPRLPHHHLIPVQPTASLVTPSTSSSDPTKLPLRRSALSTADQLSNVHRIPRPVGEWQRGLQPLKVLYHTPSLQSLDPGVRYVCLVYRREVDTKRGVDCSRMVAFPVVLPVRGLVPFNCPAYKKEGLVDLLSLSLATGAYLPLPGYRAAGCTSGVVQSVFNREVGQVLAGGQRVCSLPSRCRSYATLRVRHPATTSRTTQRLGLLLLYGDTANCCFSWT